MKSIILLCVALLSGLLAFCTNRLALRQWRRTADRHWSERARVLFPIRRAAATNVWVLPAVLALGAWLLLPVESPHWLLMVLAGLIGAIAGTIPMDRETFPRISVGELIRQCVLTWFVRVLTGVVFFTAIVLMPDVFNSRAALITVAFVLLLFIWSRIGALGVCRLLGLCVRPPEHLHAVVRDTAGKMNVPFREVWLLRSPFANAYAMPGTGRLLFSERLLALLSDAEISAICAHELAHLAERRSEYLRRYLAWLAFLPWIFFNPLLHHFGMGGFYLLLLGTMLTPKMLRGISQKLEKQADDIARAHEAESGVYAAALARLYEDSLLPVVNSRRTASHPDLYDRMESAGITPDFPRPARPENMAWHGHLFSGALGFTAVLAVLKYLYES